MSLPISYILTRDSCILSFKIMIRVLIVDDQKTCREALKAQIASEPDLEIVGTANDGNKAIEQVEILQPDVVLMDMEMPRLDGVSATKQICQRFPNCKVLVLSIHDSDEYVAKAMQSGARGYLIKTISTQELQKAIRFVHRGYARIMPGLYAQIVPTFGRVTSTLETIKLAERLSLELELERLSVRSSNLQTLNKNTSSALRQREIEPVYSQSTKEVSWLQVLILSMVAIAMTGGIYWLRQYLRQPLPSLSLAQQTTTLAETEFLGKIEPAKTFKMAAVTPGIVEAVYVKVGQPIKAGQPLFSVKNLEAENAIAQKRQQQQLALQQEQIALQQQQSSQQQIFALKQQIAYLAQSSSPLATELAEAEMQVSVVQSQSDRLPLPQRQDSVERTQAIYHRALSKVNRFQQLYNEGGIAKDQLEQAQADLEVAQADLKVAKEAARVTQNLELARNQKSRLQLQLAVQEQQDKLKQIQKQLQAASLEYKQATDRLTTLKAQTAQLLAQPLPAASTIVKATNNGIAIELPVNVGEQVFTGNPLIALAQLDHLNVEVAVNARLINALSPGQPAAIKIGTKEGARSLKGRIVSINPLPDQELNHTVEVQFDNPTQALLVGQLATIQF
jgi:DNA-binding NarL/FixJ family response regulator/multidrug resistance efflux pump